MKKVTIAVVVTVATLSLVYLLFPMMTHSEPEAQATSTPQLSQRQLTWISALEWCESRGIPEAVNPKDKDGTPSYGSFQFKPDTFWYFADKYGVKTDSVAEALDKAPLNEDGTKTIRAAYYNREDQLKVIEQMVLHSDEIDWYQQFPDCIKRVVGRPPSS